MAINLMYDKKEFTITADKNKIYIGNNSNIK